jgi:hypothetical protein
VNEDFVCDGCDMNTFPFFENRWQQTQTINISFVGLSKLRIIKYFDSNISKHLNLCELIKVQKHMWIGLKILKLNLVR